MARKRKRPSQVAWAEPQSHKRAKTNRPSSTCKQGVLAKLSPRHSVLKSYYPRVLSLREFLLEKLPPTSKFRRRQLNGIGSGSRKCGNGHINYMDTTLVGVLRESDAFTEETRRRDFLAFTQSQQKPDHSGDGVTQPHQLADVRGLSNGKRRELLISVAG